MEIERDKKKWEEWGTLQKTMGGRKRERGNDAPSPSPAEDSQNKKKKRKE